MTQTFLQIDIPPASPQTTALDGNQVAIEFLDYDTPVGTMFGFAVAEKVNNQFYAQRLDISMFQDSNDEMQAFADLLKATGGSPSLTKEGLAAWLATQTNEQVVAAMASARRRLISLINADLAIAYPRVDGGNEPAQTPRSILQYWLRSRVVLTTNPDGSIVASDPTLPAA
jgi:hypothetical protein